MADFAGLIPAAGLGRRAGGPKAALVLPDDPRPLLKRCIDGLIRAGARRVIVVVRPEHLALSENPAVTAVAPIRPPIDDRVRAARAVGARAPGMVRRTSLCPVDAARAAEARLIGGCLLPSALMARALSSPPSKVHRSSGLAPRYLWGRLHQDTCSTQGAKAAFVGAAHWAVTDPAVLDNVNVRLS